MSAELSKDNFVLEYRTFQNNKFLKSRENPGRNEMYQALYRTYRPEVFEEILGQEHIVKILKNQIKTDSVSHAYLFCGTRGTGKTTTARILAKGLNCLADSERPCGKCASCLSIKEGTFMDVIEMDAASNNGVENIRELRESVKYPPAIGRKKIYIIDEVHMLSTEAFNALLKTIEEPPEYVVFILATTEPQKLPATILSRCMRLDFRRVSENTLVSGMKAICRDKGIDVSEDALRLIAANADGSVRDGLSILDQCLSGGQSRVTRDDVLEFLGTSGIETFIEMTDFVLSGKTAEAILLLSNVLADGKDVRQFIRDWLSHYRGLLISKFVKDAADILNISSENAERLKEQSDKIDIGEINYAIVEISKTMADAKWSTQPRVLLELCIVKLSESSMRKEISVHTPRRSEPIQKHSIKEEPAVLQTQAQNTEAEETDLILQELDEGRQSTGADAKTQNAPVDTQILNRQSEPEKKMDLDLLWHRVFEDGENFKTSFNLIRSGTRLISIDDKYFFVQASNSLKLRYLKENASTLEDLMEKHTGMRRQLKCGEEGSAIPGTDGGEIPDSLHKANKSKSETDIEALKALAESELGIEIDIE